MFQLSENHIFSIYIHWPFCIKKCPYCDFNVHKYYKIDEESWEKSLIKELKSFKYNFLDKISKKIFIKSIFFGGGTPSIMPIKIIEKLIEYIKNNFYHDQNLEITIEANPEKLTNKNLKLFFSSGVNRLSIGIQSLDEKILTFLGRNHNVSEAIKIVENSTNIFDKVSVDLIYGINNQKIESWINQLDIISKLNVNHISTYQLTIEPQTPFYKRFKNGEKLIVNDKISADFYVTTNQFLFPLGFQNYEISNYSRKGNECIHNLNYWNSGNWLGVGPGAHSRFNFNSKRRNIINIKDPKKWIKNIRKFDNSICSDNFESGYDYLIEKLIMGLRLSDGINIKRLNFHPEFKKIIKKEYTLRFIKEGWINLDDNNFSLSSEGRIRLDYILNMLIN